MLQSWILNTIVSGYIAYILVNFLLIFTLCLQETVGLKRGGRTLFAFSVPKKLWITSCKKGNSLIYYDGCRQCLGLHVHVDKLAIQQLHTVISIITG